MDRPIVSHPLDPSLLQASAGLPEEAAPAFSPLYQQIKKLLMERLQAGQWKPGDLIPSELELAAGFGVSQGTVRKAIDELASEHLLVRRQGKGTYVATHTERRTQYRFLRLLPDVDSATGPVSVQRRIVVCQSALASAEVARQLSLRPADPVLQVKRVLSIAGSPVIFEDLWLPGGPFKGLTQERLSDDTGPMYALFESQFGVRMVRAREKIKAVGADPEAAELLGVALGGALLSVERLAYTYSGVPMEWRRGLYRTDSHYYSNELS